MTFFYSFQQLLPFLKMWLKGKYSWSLMAHLLNNIIDPKSTTLWTSATKHTIIHFKWKKQLNVYISPVQKMIRLQKLGRLQRCTKFWRYSGYFKGHNRICVDRISNSGIRKALTYLFFIINQCLYLLADREREKSVGIWTNMITANREGYKGKLHSWSRLILPSNNN